MSSALGVNANNTDPASTIDPNPAPPPPMPRPRPPGPPPGGPPEGPLPGGGPPGGGPAPGPAWGGRSAPVALIAALQRTLPSVALTQNNSLAPVRPYSEPFFNTGVLN